jgi:hypothetical protein
MDISSEFRGIAAFAHGRWPVNWPLRPLRGKRWADQEPTYLEASPPLIQAMLKRGLSRPSGNWFVFAANHQVRADRPFGRSVAGRELVAWRDDTGAVHVGPGACPHLGAPLAQAVMEHGALRCRWHGLLLTADGANGWSPLPVHDDGVLIWVRLDDLGGEAPSRLPIVADRPVTPVRLATVASVVGTCEPEDIVANRLDPWHGAWFHPYSFARLHVVETPPDTAASAAEDRFVVDVTFRVAQRLGVPVRAQFSCPEPRTVVMRIIEGEGAGSVVETHATPLGPGADGRARTAVIEATVVSSPRPGFTYARRAAPLLRPVIRWAAARLWRDDIAYAERRYSLRTNGC